MSEIVTYISYVLVAACLIVAVYFAINYFKGEAVAKLQNKGVIESPDDYTYEKRCEVAYNDPAATHVHQNLPCACVAMAKYAGYRFENDAIPLCHAESGIFKCARVGRYSFDVDGNKAGEWMGDRMFKGNSIGDVQVVGVEDMVKAAPNLAEDIRLHGPFAYPDIAHRIIIERVRRLDNAVGFVMIANTIGDESLEMLGNPEYKYRSAAEYETMFYDSWNPGGYKSTKYPNPHDAAYVYVAKSQIAPRAEWSPLLDVMNHRQGGGIWAFSYLNSDACLGTYKYTKPPPNKREELYFPNPDNTTY